MLVVLSLWVMLDFVGFSDCEFEGKIVGGQYASITNFPHSAFLAVQCVVENDIKSKKSWMCGSSILNQELLLTAAHCVAECSPRSWFLVSVGHEHILKGFKHTVYSYIVHEDYYPGLPNNDIGLARLSTPLKFSSTVSRVILMPKPPYHERGQVAGWGITNEFQGTQDPELKYIDQYVWNKKECIDLLMTVPIGTFCGTSRNSKDYASGGDSGSALVVRGYLQIGLVSFKRPFVNRSVVVYTDTGYFYDWIEEYSKFILCDEDLISVYLS